MVSPRRTSPSMLNLQNDQIVYITFTTAFFVGIYFATFLQSLRCLLFTRRGWELRSVNSTQWPIVFVSLSIFGLSVINHGVELKSRGQETLPHLATESWKTIAIVSLCTLLFRLELSLIYWYVKCTTTNLTVQLTDAVLVRHSCISVRDLIKLFRYFVCGKSTITLIAS